MAALDDRPRPTITAEAKAWAVNLACRKAKELGYSTNCGRRGCSPAMCANMGRKLAHGMLCIILNEQEIKPHKVRYYLERRDPDFKAKMAEVLCVYREVKLIRETAAAAKQASGDAVAIISCEAGPSGDCDHRTGPAVRAWHPREVCARWRIQAPRHGQFVGRP